MEIHERIKKIRTELKLSQEKFGERIGVSRDVINNIERNRLARPEQKEPLYLLICKEFNVNYLWLTEGIGDPKAGMADNLFDDIKVEYNLSDDDTELLEEICELEGKERKELKKYIRSLIKASKEKEEV